MMKTLAEQESETPPTPRNPMTLLTNTNSPQKKRTDEYIGNGLISARERTPLKGGAGLTERIRKQPGVG